MTDRRRKTRARDSGSSSIELRWFLRFAAAVVAAGALAVALFLVLRQAPVEPLVPSSEVAEDAPVGVAIGKKAPDFSLPSLSGTPFVLSDHRGSVLILDFWASWCTPCKATFPHLHSVWESVADSGALLVGVSLDRSRADAVSYLEGTGYGDMIALWGSLAAASSVASTYQVEGIPHTLVIDRDGIIRYIGHPAYLRTETIAEFVE